MLKQTTSSKELGAAAATQHTPTNHGLNYSPSQRPELEGDRITHLPTPPLPPRPLSTVVDKIVDALPDLTRAGFRCPFTPSDSSFHVQRDALRTPEFTVEVAKVLALMKDYAVHLCGVRNSAAISSWAGTSVGAVIVALQIVGYGTRRIPGNPNVEIIRSGRASCK